MQKTKKQLIEEIKVLQRKVEKPKKAPSGRTGRSLSAKPGIFRDTLDNIDIGGLAVDRNRTIVYCNRNVGKIFGYTSREMTGKRTELLYGDRRRNPLDKSEIYNILEKNGFHIGTAKGFKKNGDTINLLLSTFVVRPDKGAIIFIKKIKKALEMVIDKEIFLQDLLDNIPDMIYFKDLRNRFVLVNKAHASALGLVPEEVQGKSDMDFFPRELARKYSSDDKYIVRTGNPVIGKIEKAPREDGGITYVSTTKIPHYDENGKIIGTIGITRNITDQMIAEEELREYKDGLEDLVEERTKELEESNSRLRRMYEIKSEFTSMVSHELRAPLTAIKEGVSQLEDGIMGPVNKKQKNNLQMISRSIDRLTRLINDILDSSKLERKKMKFEILETNLNETINQVIRSYEASIKKKGLRIESRLDVSLPLVHIDPDRIAQVLYNLINNALKFTEKGYIRVKSQVAGGEVKVSVKDTGYGIRSRDLPRVFEKFEQVSSNSSLKRSGTGLGLSICKQIIEQMGGRISVKSVYGKGSDFLFILPVKK